MNIIEATEGYEAWVGRHLALEQLALDQDALGVKHDEMAKAPFGFLRATFYRWVQCWPEGQEEWRKAPKLLAVGDVHAENFGTWRDAEGRLVWGVNDFDEMSWLPYTNDLVRLAVSAKLAIKGNHYLALDFRSACGQILAGYEKTLRLGKEGALPLVLSEANDWLRDIAAVQLRDPAVFWDKLERYCVPQGGATSSETEPLAIGMPESCGVAASGQTIEVGEMALGGRPHTFRSTMPVDSTPDRAIALAVEEVPASGRAAIESQLPEGFQAIQWKKRQAGVGSLGRPRFVALGLWKGARLAREGKARVPSAVFWARSGKAVQKTFQLSDMLDHAVRCPDPHYVVSGQWLVRRLAPDCTKLELFDIPKRREDKFLYAMGCEIANLHLSSQESIPKVLKHLEELPKDWLEEAAQEYFEMVMRDWEDWREYHKGKRRKNRR